MLAGWRIPYWLVLASVLAAGPGLAAQAIPSAPADQVRQEPTDEIGRWIEDLQSPDAQVAARARSGLVGRGTESASRLLTVLNELVPTNGELLPSDARRLTGLFGVVRELRLRAPDDVSNLMQVRSRLFKSTKWSEWEAQSPQEASEAWDQLWIAATSAVSSTGAQGIRYLWAQTLVPAGQSLQPWKAYWILSDFDPGPEGVQEILDVLDRGDERMARWAAVALSNVGSPAVDILWKAIDGSDRVRRLRALMALGAFHDQRAVIAPMLERLLDDPDADARYWACDALSTLLPESLPGLLYALRHDDARVRIRAAEALERAIVSDWQIPRTVDSLAPADDSPYAEARKRARVEREEFEFRVAPELTRALSDPADPVRVFAAFALYKLGRTAAVQRAIFADARGDRSAIVQLWARLALERIDQTPWHKLELLVEHLAPSLEVGQERSEGAWLLKSIEPGLDRKLPELLATANGPPGDPARFAAERLDLIEQRFDQRLADLLRILDDEWSPGAEAGRSLAACGAAALPALARELLRNPRFPMGDPTYAELMWVLEQRGEAALPILIEGLQHWNQYGRGWAAQAIPKLGPRALPAVPFVLSAWRSSGLSDSAWDYDGPRFEGYDSPTHPSYTVGSMGPAAFAAIGPAAIPWWIAGLSDPHAVVRARSARVLGALGAEGIPALDALKPCLGDPEAFVRDAAAAAIRAIAPATDER